VQLKKNGGGFTAQERRRKGMMKRLHSGKSSFTTEPFIPPLWHGDLPQEGSFRGEGSGKNQGEGKKSSANCRGPVSWKQLHLGEEKPIGHDRMGLKKVVSGKG